MSLAAMMKREEESLDVIMKTLGGWPMTNGQWDESQFNLATLLGTLRTSYGYTPLVFMYVSVDERNSAAHRILVGKQTVHACVSLVLLAVENRP